MLIKKYTSKWIENFAKIKREIEKALIEIDFVIEHIGSTSVPNLDAKDIIDIDIIFKQESDFARIKAGLIKIGYYHNGNQGVEQREVFKRTGLLNHATLDTIPHHLYVCPFYCEALERHILFRDYLRNNDWARLEYQQMKYKLAKDANQNKKVYAALKELNINDFIDSIIWKEKIIDSNRYDDLSYLLRQ